MKKNPTHLRHLNGFTLVELLVVIVIIASLAALALTVGPKMRKRADAAKSVENMRQIGATMGLFMADNSNALPQPRQEILDSNGNTVQVHWHQALLAQIYPSVETGKFNERPWWISNKPFLWNPLMTDKLKPNAFAPWFPGYSINMQINYNITSNYDWNAQGGGPQTKKITIMSIPEPSKTPLVSVRGDWHYSTADMLKAEIKPFLVDGKLPILFVDGHVETLTPNEYALPRPKGRNYENVPPKKVF